MKRDPRINPVLNDRLVRTLFNSRGIPRLHQRIVLTFDGQTVVYCRHRKRPQNKCHCSLEQWRHWCQEAHAVPLPPVPKMLPPEPWSEEKTHGTRSMDRLMEHIRDAKFPVVGTRTGRYRLTEQSKARVRQRVPFILRHHLEHVIDTVAALYGISRAELLTKLTRSERNRF